MNVEKPFVLNFLETKQALVDIVNKAAATGIPFVVIDTILSDITKQVAQCALQEKESATAAFTASLAESAKGIEGTANE